MAGVGRPALPVGALERGWPRLFGADDVEAAEPLVGLGDECALWRVGDRLVRCSPTSRTLEQLGTAYRRAAWLSRRVPELVAPIPAADGTLVRAIDAGFVSVWPFVHGRHLDRDNAAERAQAASLLVRLHAAGRDWAGRDWAGRDWAGRGLTLVHGDFYRRNLLVRDGRLVALVDVDDIAEGKALDELAWATLELCKTPDAMRVARDRAGQFVRSYVETGGGPVDEPLVPAMLRRVRGEIAASEAAAVDADLAYLASISSVVADLRTWPRTWPLER